MNDQNFVSVIVPTYKDGRSLQKCLHALQAQTYSKESFEVIVVNNDAEAIDLNIALPPNATLIHESKPGSYSARNKGIDHAKGEIFAFTDADCIPSQDWIQKSVAELQNGHDRIAGHVRVFGEKKNRTLGEAYEFVLAFDQKNNAQSGNSVTANLVCWRYCFDHTGLFNTEMLSGGDIEWNYRATKAGLSIKYAPDAVVYHPARDSIGKIFRKRRRTAGGFPVLSRHNRTRFWFIIGIMPPVFAFRMILYSKRITVKEKIALLPISYLIELYSTFTKTAIRDGWLEPSRR